MVELLHLFAENRLTLPCAERATCATLTLTGTAPVAHNSGTPLDQTRQFALGDAVYECDIRLPPGIDRHGSRARAKIAADQQSRGRGADARQHGTAWYGFCDYHRTG